MCRILAHREAGGGSRPLHREGWLGAKARAVSRFATAPAPSRPRPDAGRRRRGRPGPWRRRWSSRLGCRDPTDPRRRPGSPDHAPDRRGSRTPDETSIRGSTAPPAGPRAVELRRIEPRREGGRIRHKINS